MIIRVRWILFFAWFVHNNLASLLLITTRIIGGSSVFIEEAPFMASVQYLGKHICGGTIVSRQQVLTAAHCTNGRQPNKLTIRVGSTLREFGGQVVGVAKVYQNPKFSYRNYDYDVSVLHLSFPLTLGSKISPITLASKKQKFRAGTEATTYGWGTVSEKNQYQLSRWLQRVSIKIIDNATCKRLLPNDLVTERMLCAGILRGGKDSCKGDSGGALVVRKVLVGITSWGHGCGKFNSPGVYSNIAALRSYIDKHDN